VPAFLFPEWMQSLTLVMPTRWAVDGFDGVTWRGLDLAASARAMAVLLGFALAFGGLALWKFRGDQRK
jgi:ABC-2 type transport system permease protein